MFNLLVSTLVLEFDYLFELIKYYLIPIDKI